jgi:hypothetical protein
MFRTYINYQTDTVYLSMLNIKIPYFTGPLTKGKEASFLEEVRIIRFSLKVNVGQLVDKWQLHGF